MEGWGKNSCSCSRAHAAVFPAFASDCLCMAACFPLTVTRSCRSCTCFPFTRRAKGPAAPFALLFCLIYSCFIIDFQMTLCQQSAVHLACPLYGFFRCLPLCLFLSEGGQAVGAFQIRSDILTLLSMRHRYGSSFSALPGRRRAFGDRARRLLHLPWD